MATTMKMCDMRADIAARVFELLNPGKVTYQGDRELDIERIIITDVEPQELVYPEGWYYAKGNLRNKYTSTTGAYEEIPMFKSNGDYWKDHAIYCTLYSGKIVE